VLLVAAAATGTWAIAGDGPTPEAATVGEPNAPGMMALLYDEMLAGLKSRGIDSRFQQFRNYAGFQLNITAGAARNSEVTGNCRLTWYDHLLRNPLTAPAEAEAFTRNLFQSLKGGPRGLDEALATARDKMDLGRRDPVELDAVESPEEALSVVEQALVDAQIGHAASLAPLTPGEIDELTKNLYSVLVTQNDVGHTLANRGMGRRLCDLMEKMDRRGIHDAAAALARLADPPLLEQLGEIPEGGNVVVRGVTGTVVRQIVTSAGTIVIGGRGPNTYDLDEMPYTSAVIDLGGDDVYREGTVSIRRPVLVTLDLGGNDAYDGTRPGIQGGAILGIAMLVDAAGDDVYRARDVAQASCLAGAGILIDYAGDDVYIGLRRVQGQAFGGLGILVDHAGNDRYRGAMWTQGMGSPLGFGMLADLDGEDHYYTGGLYICSYIDDEDSPTPGYEGWGQGVGAGPRSVASGGIGVILDGGGDDVYEFDYLSHGGGYWMGIGFARDFGGNDQRLGATLKTYSGGERTQRRYQRFGTGFGCHYAAGFCFDDAGDDAYYGTIMGVGHAWDCSIGALCDFGGNDRYESTGSTTQGNGSQASLGILFDYDGDDQYKGNNQGYASSGISYHTLPNCGGNFSFVVDYGGEDTYGCKAKNNSYNQRGSSGGFLIDRPKAGPESDKTATNTSTKTTAE
jgi:hypothetical protein